MHVWMHATCTLGALHVIHPCRLTTGSEEIESEI